MPYYGRGDYYAGRFRGAGDPGLFDWVGRIGKAALGFATGGPLGAIGSLVGSGTGRQAQIPTPEDIIRNPFGKGAQPFPNARYVNIGPEDGFTGPIQPGFQCPPGYHPDKKTKSKCVRNRSMNVTNPKALRRAIRREEGFISLAKRFNLRPPPRQRSGSGLKTRKRSR